MPIYNFLDKETNVEFEVNCTYEEAKELEGQGNFKWLPSNMNIVSSAKDVRANTPDSFRDVLKSIKQRYHRSTIETS